MAAFKDQIARTSVERLGSAVAGVDPTFPYPAFVDDALHGLDALELKARVAHVADALGRHLAPFTRAASIMKHAVTAGTPWHGFDLWPVQHWAMVAGLDEPDVALPLIAHVTPLSSGEFAIRPYIDRDPGRLAAIILQWARHPDEHVRRLASEGSRPRLPWGPRLSVPPGWALPVLDLLYDDPSEYVRRSVANHLNDISYDDVDLALAVARHWATSPSEHTEWVVRHGLRSLVKKGHPDALALIGADHKARLAVDHLGVTPLLLAIGGSVTMSLTVRSEEPTAKRVVVDYTVHFVGARGGTNTKTFRWRTLDIEPHTTAELVKRHAFRDVSIRTHRPGEHTIVVQVNGQPAGTLRVTLQSDPV